MYIYICIYIYIYIYRGVFIFRLCVRAKINKNKGLPNKQLRNIKLGWADFQIGWVFFYKMLEFLVGVACGAKKFLYFTSKVTFSRYFWLFVFKMLEFPVGVACGAKKFLYFTPKVTFSRYFCFWAPAGSKS